MIRDSLHPVPQSSAVIFTLLRFSLNSSRDESTTIKNGGTNAQSKNENDTIVIVEYLCDVNDCLCLSVGRVRDQF